MCSGWPSNWKPSGWSWKGFEIMSTTYAVWRIYDDRPGLVDYVGSLVAEDAREAEAEAERRYGPLDDDERFDIEVDDESLQSRGAGEGNGGLTHEYQRSGLGA
jgi:hypothetical protein